MSADKQMTNICGYYNGNRWPIQLVISKLNITLTLEPGKYVLDRSGRKINDPYFEVFANNKQLHRETSATPVPLIIIPEVTSANTPTAPGNPVRAVTAWTRDAKGLRQPVLEQAPTTTPAATALPAAVVASATDSVTPMSMDEARKRGLVRKTRDVPEDYGVTDTTGIPPSGIPKMKYAIDPGVNRPAPPLPPQMLTVAKDDPARQTKSQLVAGLAQGAKAPVVEDSNPFANTSVRTAPVNSPIIAGTPMTVAESAESTLPVEGEMVEADAVDGTAEGQQSVDQVLPEPELEPETETEPVRTPPVQPSAARPAAVRPPPATASTTPATPPVRPLTPSTSFVCMACSQTFKFRSLLAKHAQTKHPDRVSAILAPYPETRTLP